MTTTRQRWETLLARNEGFAETHKPSIKFPEMPKGDAGIIVTCMDPRCNPDQFLKLDEMEIAVVRNAGGRAGDAMRSLRVLSAIAGYGSTGLGVVAVIHHTDCGVSLFSDEFITGRVRENTRDDKKNEVPQTWDFWQDMDAGVREDVDTVKNDPFLSEKVIVLGYVYDIESGKLRQVV